MQVNWSIFLTIVLAYLVAKVLEGMMLRGGSEEGNPGSNPGNPGNPVVVYANPIDEYLAKHYPNA